MTLELTAFVLCDVLDLGFQVFMGALGARQIVGHFDYVVHFQMVEYLRVLFDQYTEAAGGDIPKLELVERGEAFSGELYAVIPIRFRPSFRSSFR